MTLPRTAPAHSVGGNRRTTLHHPGGARDGASLPLSDGRSPPPPAVRCRPFEVCLVPFGIGPLLCRCNARARFRARFRQICAVDLYAELNAVAAPVTGPAAGLTPHGPVPSRVVRRSRVRRADGRSPRPGSRLRRWRRATPIVAAHRRDDDGAAAPGRRRARRRPQRPRRRRAATSGAPLATGVTSAAARTPTTTAFTPASAAATPGRPRSQPRTGRAASTSRAPAGRSRPSPARAPGDAARSCRRHGAEVGGEREQRARHRLRGAVAREELVLAHPARSHDAGVEQRQHDVPAAEHERARADERRDEAAPGSRSPWRRPGCPTTTTPNAAEQRDGLGTVTRVRTIVCGLRRRPGRFPARGRAVAGTAARGPPRPRSRDLDERRRAAPAAIGGDRGGESEPRARRA